MTIPTPSEEPIGFAAVLLALTNIIWVLWPDIRPGLSTAIDGFLIVLTSWYARRNSTPNVRVRTTSR